MAIQFLTADQVAEAIGVFCFVIENARIVLACLETDELRPHIPALLAIENILYHVFILKKQTTTAGLHKQTGLRVKKEFFHLRLRKLRPQCYQPDVAYAG